MHTVAPLTKHPAPFSEPIVGQLRRLIDFERRRLAEAGEPAFVRVLDPFAGVGRIHRIHRPGYVETQGLELEPEWAACHERTRHGDVMAMPRGWYGRFHVIATSPDYGNRFSDGHDPKDPSERRGYKFDLGRDLSDASLVAPWGPRYWRGHADAYRSMLSALRRGGLLLLNVSDFVADAKVVPVVAWHMGVLSALGLDPAGRAVAVPTRRMRKGQNHGARVAHEVILRYRRPA